MIHPRTPDPELDEAGYTVAYQRYLWNQLHCYAARYPSKPTEEDKQDAELFLKEWAEDIPEDCPCLKEWNDILDTMQPELDTCLSFLWWTVAAHDRINILLEKPIWSGRSKTHKLVTSLADGGGDAAARARLALSRKPLNRL